jgi:invasion protein IalB
MTQRVISAANAIVRKLAGAALPALVVFAGASVSLAQQPPAPKAQPKAQPKAAPPAAAAPKAQPKGPPAAGQSSQQQQQAGQGQPQISFSPWTKLCPKGPDANAKKLCFTGRDGRVESGMPVVAAVLVEPEGEPKKMLRITLPLGMALQPGTRLVVDQGQPITAPYVTCIPNGCVADYEASQDLINNMKKGTGLVLQGISGNGQGVSIVIPLADFGKVHDGAPMSEKDFEELQKKLQQQAQQQQSQAQSTAR